MWNNKVFVNGRLTADPEIKAIGEEGRKVANFRIAVNRRPRKGDEHPEADFFRVSAFGATADFVEKYFSKGSSMNLWGNLRSSTYEKDGKKISVVDIIAEDIGFGDSKKNSEAEADSSAPKKPKPAPVVADENDDDFPF